jgi:Protein of unknown function (DUF3179)
VWGREIDGLRLTFHLAGINNQNFLMKDEQTGTYWQQITGAAISGPLAGRRLTLVASDELTFAMWRAEEPYVSEYAKKDWEVRMKKRPTVLSYADPALGLEPRTLMLGIRAFGASRAFPYEVVVKEKLVQDRVGVEPVLLVVGPDGKSIRAFRDRIPGVDGAPAFYRTLDDKQAHPTDAAWLERTAMAPLLMDAATGGEWNFQGCALSGKAKGFCLERVEVIKDYWFDWRHYNAATTVYARKV